jgi:glycosyltransferase involved in cell wall biosynthesis
LHPPGDARALAARLEDLLTDPQRRSEFGRAGRARFQREFTVAAMQERMLLSYGFGLKTYE